MWWPADIFTVTCSSMRPGGDPNAWKHFRPELDRAWEPYTMPLGSEGMIAADLAHQINLTRINVRTHSQAG